MNWRLTLNTKAWPLVVGLTVSVAAALAVEPVPDSKDLNQIVNFGDWQKARQICTQILQKTPDDEGALLAQARLDSYTAKTNDAIILCNKILAKQPQYSSALLLRGTNLCSVGQTSAGQIDLKRYLVLTEGARDSESQYGRGVAFLNLKDSDKAKKIFQDIDSQFASSSVPEDIFNVGLAQINLGKFNEAIATLSKLRGVSSVAPRLTSRLAYCHSETGSSVLAMREYEEIATQEPHFYEVQGGWGWQFEKAKKYDLAIWHYDQALKVEERYLYGLRRRGHCHFMEGNSSLALVDLGNAIKLEPDDKVTLMERAMVCDLSNDFQLGIEDCKHLVALDPKHDEAWCQLGHLYTHVHKYSDAYYASNEALKFSPKSYFALCTRALAESQLGQFTAAEADYNNAVSIAPEMECVYFGRGQFFRMQKKYALAIADLAKAVTIDPRDPMAYCVKGCCEVRNGNYKEAIVDCTRSLELSRYRTHPYLSRGEAYAALGQNDLALIDFNFVLLHEPANAEAKLERAKVLQKKKKPKISARPIPGK